MANQIILAVDDQDNFKGEYIPKEVGHTGAGKRHLAISVLLYIGASDILPEAHSQHSTKGTIFMTILGVGLIYLVTQVV